MNITPMMEKALLIAVCLTCLLVVGCDYVPREVYEIETKDGVTLKMACPTLARGRSVFSYFYDGDCILVKD